MIRYSFKDDPLTLKNAKKADPQAIGEALEKITVAGGGRLTPTAVVEAARNTRNPLHRHFEWDDAEAAASYRLDQARQIIRVIRVEDDDSVSPARAFVNIVDKVGAAYRRLEDIKNSADLQALVLQQAERDLKSFETRYRELGEICEIVRDAREAIAERRRKTTESRPDA